jgi:thioredoxin reductase (NADPH)
MPFKKIAFFFFTVLLSFKPLPAAQPAEEYPVVILGGGIAALTAAVQVSQAGLQPMIIAGPMPGGIIVQSHSVHNWPGEIEISGAQLADKLQKQAEACGVIFHPGHVIDIDTTQHPFVITTQNFFEKTKTQKIKARTCIVALGALPKLLNVPGERENLFVNIFTCAPCDGLRFKDKTVAVIGGGDSALIEAQYLSNLAKKVYIIVRKDEFKTVQSKQKEAILAHPNIEVIYNSVVESFSRNAQGLNLHLATSNGPQQLSVNGAFLAIGSLPNTDLFKGKLELDSDGYIILKDNQETSVPGIFAAGDVSDKIFRQAMTAAGDATKAALQAQKYFGVKVPDIQSSVAAPVLEEITSLEALRKMIATSDRPIVAYFYSHQCNPCRSFRFTYNKWASQFKDKARFVKINDQTGGECFLSYGIKVIPTVVVFDKGQVLYHGSGKELVELPSVLEKVKKT